VTRHIVSLSDFAHRLFTYNYRFYDRFATPIASLAVLADESEGRKPDRYGFDVLGCRHRLEFPVVKLLDYAERVEPLESDHKLFAVLDWRMRLPEGLEDQLWRDIEQIEGR